MWTLLALHILLPWSLATDHEQRADDNGERANISLPLSPQFTSLELDVPATTCPTNQQRVVALQHISNGIRSELEELTETVLECDRYLLGKIAHCPADNCSVLFEQLEKGLLRFSGFYWLQLPNENPARVFCDRETGYAEVSSCSLLFKYHPSAKSGLYTLLLRDGVRSVVFCNRETGLPEPESCAHAHQLELPSGYYTLRPPPDNVPLNHTVYCDMNHAECGTAWWVKVASLNLSDETTVCPENWQLMTSPVRACTRSTGEGCDSAFFSSYGHNYTRVCGRVLAHQRGPAYGFWLSGQHNSLDLSYLNGASLTHGETPRHHIWSFAASLGNSYCPCGHRENVPHPSFVGEHYFCESDRNVGPTKGVLNLDNPLWDGTDCSVDDTCCLFNNPPWFTRDLASPTTDDLEVRLCGYNTVANHSTPITMLELYVQ